MVLQARGAKGTIKMSLVCRTLVLVGGTETLKLVAHAFPPPKYELEFVDTPEEAGARTVSGRMDLFIVDSRFADHPKINSIRSHMPTMFMETEYVQGRGKESTIMEESDRVRTAAEKLLRKNYINWIIDALEYSS